MKNPIVSRFLLATLVAVSPCLGPSSVWAAQAVMRPVSIRLAPNGLTLGGNARPGSLAASLPGTLTPSLALSLTPSLSPSPSLAVAPSPAAALDAAAASALDAQAAAFVPEPLAALGAAAQLETGRAILENPQDDAAAGTSVASRWESFWSASRAAPASEATPAAASLGAPLLRAVGAPSAPSQKPSVPAFAVAAAGVSAPFAWFAQLAAVAAPYAWIGGFALSIYASARAAKAAAGKLADWAKWSPAVKESLQKVSMVAAVIGSVSIPTALPELFAVSKPYLAGAGVVAATYGLNVLLNRAIDKTSAAFEWSAKTTRILRAGATSALWLAGLGAGLESAGYSTQALASSAWAFVAPFTGTGGAIVGAVFVSRYAGRLVTWLKTKGWIDPTHEGLWRRLAYVVVWTSAGVIGLHTAGVSATALLATAGIGAVFATLAAKKVIGNLMRGVMLLLNAPFQQGERIRIDGETYLVEDMTLQNVVLKPSVGETTTITYNELAGKVIVVEREYKTKEERRALPRFGLKDFLSLAKQKTAEIDMKSAAVWMGLGLGLTFVMPALTAWIGIGPALPYLQAAAVLVASRTTERWLTGFINGLAQRNGWSRQSTMVIRLGARAVVYGASFWIGLGVLGLSFGKLMATMGASSVVFGWATADVFQSVIDGAKNLWANSRNFGKIVKVGKHQGLFVDMNLHHIVLATGPESHILIPQSMMDFFTVLGPPEPGDPFGQDSYKTLQGLTASTQKDTPTK
mgnify:FL=1